MTPSTVTLMFSWWPTASSWARRSILWEVRAVTLMWNACACSWGGMLISMTGYKLTAVRPTLTSTNARGANGALACEGGCKPLMVEKAGWIGAWFWGQILGDGVRWAPPVARAWVEGKREGRNVWNLDRRRGGERMKSGRPSTIPSTMSRAGRRWIRSIVWSTT